MCRRKMSQEITVTKTDDHYEMQFDGGNSYPVPTNAIEKLDDDLTPEETGESVTFRGDYGGHKHCKTFDVKEVIDGLEDEEDETEVETDDEAEETSAEEDVEERENGEKDVQLPDDEFGEASVGESGKCLHANCVDHADVAVKCDTGQIKHYCDDHHDGRRAGHALIVEEKRLTEPSSDDDDSTDEENDEGPSFADPTPEHVAEVGYHTAAGQAQQIEAQRLFADSGGE